MSRISFKYYVASLDAEKLSKLNYVEDPRHHYVYRITNIVEGKHYYGSRTSSVSPELDIGIEYHSTALTNSWIIEDQQNNPDNYRYKIIKSGFRTRTDANLYESYLHSVFDVKNHKSFYNGSNQTPWNFDTTGNKESIKKAMITRSKNMSNCGSRHPIAKIIYIYNSNNVLKFKCHGDFKQVCDENNLPFTALRKSYQNNGYPLYIELDNSKLSRIINMGYIKYRGWYAETQ